MPLLRRSGYITEVRNSPGRIFLEWSVHDFIGLPGGGLDYYESCHYRLPDTCLYFRVYPNLKSEGWVFFSVHRDDDATPTEIAILGFGLKGCRIMDITTEEIPEFVGNQDHSVWHQSKFCRRSELIAQKNRLMPNDSLTIMCEIKVPGNTTRDSSDLSDNSEVEVRPEIKELSENEGGKKALDDFGKLLASGEGSDVIIQGGDIELKVHSFVLFARCPALAMSLKHESKEKASSRIVIEDCESNVFRHFLQHLYTGSVLSLTERNVFSLYRIAHKYMVDDLKERCLEYLKNSLTVQTFSDVMELALTYGEIDLLLMTTEFAPQNNRLVMCSMPAWKKFLREHPTEAKIIFIKSLGPPCDSPKDKKGKKKKTLQASSEKNIFLHSFFHLI